MRVIVNDKMKEWVAAYIRAHRKGGSISIHVVFSKFNEDFERTFGVNPVSAVSLMIHEGFLKGCPAKGGFSIWLPEDAGKGHSRPFHSHEKPMGAIVAPVVQKTEMPVVSAQSGESEMDKKIADIELKHTHAFELFPHPETGVIDVLGLILYIMERAAKQLPENPEMDGGYAVSALSINKLFSDIGLSDAVRPQLTHIMSKMGLLKKYSHMSWGLLERTAIAYFITPRLYMVARDSLTEHTNRNHEIARLRNRVEKLTASPKTLEPTAVPIVSPSNFESFENEAIEALAEAEHLGEVLAKTQVMLRKMTDERDQLALDLKGRPVQAEVIKQAFNDRLAQLKRVHA